VRRQADLRCKSGAVTAADLRRVAKKCLKPGEEVLQAVVDKKEIALGHPNNPVKLEQLSGGKLTEIPLKDPLTLKPLGKGGAATK